jgi:hypothetical protein
MNEGLGELLKREGKRQADCGLTQVAISYINTGKRQARQTTITKIAQATGIAEAAIRAACDESWNRAHPTPPVGPGSDGQDGTSSVGHAAESTAPVRA